MTENHIQCGRCGAAISEFAAGGLCPRCLMAMNFDSRTMPEGEEAPQAPVLTPEELAEKFPQYEILECLGRGGMGVVYKARQKSLNRPVAIKILAPERKHEPRFAGRFAIEAELLARLSHPHIVTIHDFGETGGLFYLVMEYVDGVNLRDLLRDGKLEPGQALAIVPPICEALQYAHDKNIVHRDIKPENLLLDRDGRIKIADFGIAGLIGAGGEDIGTPPYMAPEQRGGFSGVDSRADIYALGVVLYEMLTGERPAKDLVAPSKKVRIDVRLDEMVLRALEKKPERRYQTAGEFRTVVEEMSHPAGAAEPPSAGPPPAEEKRKKRRKKVIFRLADGTPGRAALLMIALACILGGALVMVAAGPVWRILTTDHGLLLPVESAGAMIPGTSPAPMATVGAIGLGIAVLMAVLLAGFVFALVMIARGKGSGAGKGLAIGCLGLTFAAVIVVAVMIAAAMIIPRFQQPSLPPGFFPHSPAGF